MFHHMLWPKKHRRSLMNMDMDMDMKGMAKVVAGSAMLYWGMKMIADEIMD